MLLVVVLLEVVIVVGYLVVPRAGHVARYFEQPRGCVLGQPTLRSPSRKRVKGWENGLVRGRVSEGREKEGPDPPERGC